MPAKTPVEMFAEKLGITKGTALEIALKYEKQDIIMAHIQGQLLKNPIKKGNIPDEIKQSGIKYYQEEYGKY